jgi:hypothetical protein
MGEEGGAARAREAELLDAPAQVNSDDVAIYGPLLRRIFT